MPILWRKKPWDFGYQVIRKCYLQIAMFGEAKRLEAERSHQGLDKGITEIKEGEERNDMFGMIGKERNFVLC